MAGNMGELQGLEASRTWPQAATPHPGMKDLHVIMTPGVDKPSEYIATTQEPVGLEEMWKASGRYCPGCYTVSRDLGIFTDPKVFERMDSEFYMVWYVNYALLADCAERHCQFCCFMLVRLFNNPLYTFSWTPGEQKGLFSCCAEANDHGAHKKVVDAITRTREVSQKHGDIWFLVIARPSDFSSDKRYFSRMLFSIDRTTLTSGKVAQEILGPTRQITLEVSAVAGTRAADYVLAKPINVVPQSEASLDIARFWINECVSRHPCCYNQLDSVTLPTRVVDVSRFEEGEVKLVAGNVPGSYTTLSYCWGGPQDAATTKANLMKRQNGFGIDELPKTLRDALELTSRLPITYIWIDSLCIIQDSDTDKEAELPKMAAYYKNAVVAVCAGDGKCESGFLKDRGVCHDHPNFQLDKSLLKMPFLCPSGRTSQLFFREYRRYQLSQEPVSQRAWTFQEKILSPRLLFYGDRMSWHCSALQESAGGVQDWVSDTRSANSHLIRAQLSTIWQTQGADAPSSPTKDESSEPKSRDRWYWAVSEYSGRVSTFPEDKLRANAALAAEFANFYQDEYVVGLWRQTLLRDLLWSTWPRLDVLQPLQWRAPSWSWASIDDSIVYDRLPPATAHAAAKVVSVTATPSSPNFPFGEVDSAVLVLQGPVLQAPPDVIDDFMKQAYRLPTMQDSFEWRHLMIDRFMRFENEEDKTKKKRAWTVPEGSILLVLFVDAVDERKDGTKMSPSTTSSSAQQESLGSAERGESMERPEISDKLAADDRAGTGVGVEAVECYGSGPSRSSDSPEDLYSPSSSRSMDIEPSEQGDETESTSTRQQRSITAPATEEQDDNADANDRRDEAQAQAQVQYDNDIVKLYGLILAPAKEATDTFERIGSFHELKMRGRAGLTGLDQAVTIV